MDARRGQILAMRAEGHTYEEIGKVLGISRQRCHQIVHYNGRGGDYFHPKTVEKIPYVGLRDWMIKHRVSISELSRRCGVSRLATDGKKGIGPVIADRILEETGLTFEECFRREDTTDGRY